jgi:hypothetical protein
MQQAYRYRILTLAPVGLLVSAGIALVCMRTPVVVFDKVTCTIDPVLSIDAHTVIKEFLRSSSENKIKALDVISQLTTQYPWIKNVTLTLKPERSFLSIIAHTPYAQLNNTLVITSDGVILEKQFFKQYSWEHLRRVNAPAALPRNEAQQLANFVAAIPPETFNLYTCHWYTKNTILLKDMQYPFIIKTSAEHPASEKILRSCLYIKGALLRNKSLLQKSYNWIADTRFSDHIIVGKRGNADGTFI